MSKPEQDVVMAKAQFLVSTQPAPFDIHAEDPAEAWRLFKADLRMHMNICGVPKGDGIVAKDYLLLCLGHATRKWMTTIGVNEEEDTYDEIVKKIGERCLPTTSETLRDFKFWSRENDQKAAESFNHYYDRLNSMATACCFGDTRDRLLKSRLIIGLYNAEWQKQVLAADAPLPDLVRKLRSIEAGEKSARLIQTREQTTAIAGVSKAADGATERLLQCGCFGRCCCVNSETAGAGLSCSTAVAALSSKKGSCPACGRSHGRSACPAKGSFCSSCRGRDHFARCCPVQEQWMVVLACGVLFAGPSGLKAGK